jgi:outer membrane protein assembly factor BamD
MRRFALLALLIPILLAGCVTADEFEDWTPEQFYAEAKLQSGKGNYAEAIRIFEKLQGRYPYGRYAEQAQLDIAYAYFKNDEPAMALAACDRFIRQYPTHDNVDYVYYLKGIVNFRGERSLGSAFFGSPDDLFDRDPKSLREAYGSFKELVDRFPQSQYADDSRARMRYLYNAQAAYEANVARYYYKRGAYVAAVNRAKYVVENFPRTPALEHALGISVMAYEKMGLNALSDDALRVLKQNFPQTRYLSEIQDSKDG